MSSPIKPPGGPKPGVGPIGPADAKPGGSERAEAFQEALAANPAEPVAAQATGAVADISAALEAGQIDAATAVERLVEEALRAPAAQALSEAGRSELEAHLRQTLADDPALASLIKEMDS